MNPIRLLLAIVAVFAGVWVTDYLVHEIWLKSIYQANAALWRPETDIEAHIGWLFLGQFLFTLTFVWIWATGFATRRTLARACIYGVAMGVFRQAYTFILYAVQPLPKDLAVKWVFVGIAQGLLMGLLVLVYKSKPSAPAPPPQAPIA